MRIRFTWQPDEWHEAVQLASTVARRRRDVPMMTYGVLGMLSLGAVGDLFSFLQSRHVQNPGADIFLGGAFTVAAGSGLVWLTRTGLQMRRVKQMPPVPKGQQQVAFQEAGWSTCSDPASDEPVVRPWQDLHMVRTGARVVVATGSASAFAAVPLRTLSIDEAGHLQRLFSRKLRPSSQDDLTTVSVATY